MNIEQANAEATERMMEARPLLVGLGKARDVIPGMRDSLLLHAGPRPSPFEVSLRAKPGSEPPGPCRAPSPAP